METHRVPRGEGKPLDSGSFLCHRENSIPCINRKIFATIWNMVQVIRARLATNIKFYREKTFSDLKHGLFRFDFYIFNLNGAPAIIEVDGE